MPISYISKLNHSDIYICVGMPAYCRKRSELFTISAFLGGAVTGVVFGFYRDQIKSYFDLPALHGYVNIFLALTYLLPALVFYSGVYWLNALLVRLFGKPVTCPPKFSPAKT
jgi:hypothetical protein